MCTRDRDKAMALPKHAGAEATILRTEHIERIFRMFENRQGFAIGPNFNRDRYEVWQVIKRALSFTDRYPRNRSSRG